jgi:hypothetical protein
MSLLKGMIAAAFVCGFYATARTAEPKLFTLSCEGTVLNLDNKNVDLIKEMGVMVNLEEQAVILLGGYVSRITDVDSANINFRGEPPISGQNDYGYSYVIMGNINRLTGHMDATVITLNRKEKPVSREHYDVLCKVTHRMF